MDEHDEKLAAEMDERPLHTDDATPPNDATPPSGNGICKKCGRKISFLNNTHEFFCMPS